MSTRETLGPISLQQWKGVDQRTSPTLVQSGFFVMSRGVFFGLGDNAERIPGKKLVIRLDDPVLNIFQFEENVILQTADSVMFCTVEELTDFAIAIRPHVPVAPTFSSVSNTSLNVVLPVLSAFALTLNLQKSLDGMSWTTEGTGFAGLQIIPQTGLTPSTTYYYRAIAVNTAGTTEGVSSSVITTSTPVTPSNLEEDMSQALLEYQAAAGSILASTTGGWKTVPINAVTSDPDAIIMVLASNVITLDAGAYRWKSYLSLKGGDRGKTRIYDVTNAVELKRGMNCLANSPNESAISFIQHRFVLSAMTNIRFEYLTSTAQAEGLLYYAPFPSGSGGIETGAQIEILKES